MWSGLLSCIDWAILFTKLKILCKVKNKGLVVKAMCQKNIPYVCLWSKNNLISLQRSIYSWIWAYFWIFGQFWEKNDKFAFLAKNHQNNAQNSIWGPPNCPQMLKNDLISLKTSIKTWILAYFWIFGQFWEKQW